MAGFLIQGNTSGNLVEVTPENDLRVIRARRGTSGTLAALNSELIEDLNGDSYALITVSSTSFNGTLEFTGSSDIGGTLFYPVPVYPYAPGSAGGTIPNSATPVTTYALVAANTLVTFAVAVGQLRKLRVRASAFPSGLAAITITSDENPSLNTVLNGAPLPSSLFVTQTAAVSTGFTMTLPAVPGLRHYITELKVTRSATAALTPSATPVLLTTTNLPGNPVLTVGQDAGGIGVDRDIFLPVGEALASVALNTATTMVFPVYTGVIWRVNCAYRLGV